MNRKTGKKEAIPRSQRRYECIKGRNKVLLRRIRFTKQMPLKSQWSNERYSGCVLGTEPIYECLLIYIK